ncbi:hypothetical protein JIN85_04510 [Luteolibacter pohnpeiensis]|uniref:Uncharacterized protein n=1 Tax=Luteolibacter pohnpeiensis TaxID=454153 RepID=A0A934VTN4_9BACT|nr:hypothetical protein [Luteolibacter pohnpeiensis]MBK1881662.1 hypothetical protein [Luteolibacter pohnpeiensis]
MTARILSITNAIGCLILVGFIFYQWHQGLTTELKLKDAKTEAINEHNERMTAETKIAVLQSDIVGLKDSISSIREAYETSEKSLVEKSKEADDLAKSLSELQAQTEQWMEAIKQRDAKLLEQNQEIAATRKKLDEAIAKLKEAGAR